MEIGSRSPQQGDAGQQMLKVSAAEDGAAVGNQRVAEDVELVASQLQAVTIGEDDRGEVTADEEEDGEILAVLSKEQRGAVEKLSQLQHQHDVLEHAYDCELIALKMKYEALYQPLYEQRCEVLVQKDVANPAADAKGTPAVPRFWLDCMKRNSTLCELIEPHDAPILEYLRNISCEYFTPEEQRAVEKQLDLNLPGSEERGKSIPESFRLIFDFAPNNPFFTPQRLIKEYHLTCVHHASSGTAGGSAGGAAGGENKNGGDGDKDGGHPLAACSGGNTGGAELTSTRSTEIVWNAGKDVTKKIITRKQRNKKTKQTRTVQEVVENESFFNFFTDHEIPADDKLEAMTDKQVGELQMMVEADYDIGIVIRDKIIPQAVRWYLGEADDDDEQLEDELEDDEEADSGDELSESDEEEEEVPRGKGSYSYNSARAKGSRAQRW